MFRFSRSDFDRTLRFIQGCYEPRDSKAFSEYLLREVIKLTPGLYSVVGWMNPMTREGDAEANPVEFRLPTLNASALELAQEHPAFKRYQAGGEHQFVRLSDLCSLRQFRKTALYQTTYKPVGANDMCSMLFPATAATTALIAVVSEKRISDRDADVLRAVSPHIVQAYRAHCLLSERTNQMAAVGTALAAFGRGTVVLDLEGSIQASLGRTFDLLERYFGIRSSGQLPQAVRDWISGASYSIRHGNDVPPAIKPMVVERNGRRLVLRLFLNADRNVLHLEEECSTVDASALVELGLTRRESEVLAYVAIGKTNPEIALIFGMSARTVSKHVEHILHRLGVETRTAAATVALQVGACSSAGASPPLAEKSARP